MTNREKEILEWIKENPFISQNELAEKAKITRSSVAVHISNLIKKGMIIGKGYVVKETNSIVVIGGSNIDICAESYDTLREFDSNPGKVSTSFGGVARNIADNLTRLGENVEFISIFGDDINGNELKRNCKLLGMNIDNSLTVPNSVSSTYISILDKNKDMKVAISAMDISENFTIDFIENRRAVIESGKLCIVDTNLPEETLKYLANSFEVPLFLDCVSTIKALKVREFIGKFHTIKPNKLEAESLSGIEIKDDDDLERCANFFLEKGVKQVFISLGEKGVYFSNGDEKGRLAPFSTKILNTNGAGDAFMAGISHGYINEYSIEESCKIGVACSTLAISSLKTISDDMSLENVNRIKEENL